MLECKISLLWSPTTTKQKKIIHHLHYIKKPKHCFTVMSRKDRHQLPEAKSAICASCRTLTKEKAKNLTFLTQLQGFSDYF